ncbi:MAG: hypothetical protein QOF31_3522 [Mycobacterium sp.]|nr:hypothetical protein [Mycobacterium sp.]
MAPRVDGDGPDERHRPVEARVLRAEDLIDLRVEAPNCHFEPEDPPAEIVADAGALLVVHFPPQHVAEQAFLALASIHRRTSVMDVGFFNGAFWSVGVR